MDPSGLQRVVTLSLPSKKDIASLATDFLDIIAKLQN